ncbi:MAG: VOC family protein [Pseudomonadota bacterium]
MLALAKDSIDLGVVTTNPDDMVRFYRDDLGLVEEPSTPFPGGGTMYRLRCGTSLIKVSAPDPAPTVEAAPGPIPRATGLRYWTISVTNLKDVVAACEGNGRNVVVPPTEIRPGITIAIVEDPDGNWVELLQTS